MKHLISLVYIAFLLALPLNASALLTDSAQPATLDADEFDLDFQTGVRTYRGNVVYQQGSIRLTADEIVAYFRDGNLSKAVARGNPARFKQRPDNKPSDVVGTAQTIELDQVANIITMTKKATVTEGDNTISGAQITYNMTTEKAKVVQGKSKPRTQPAQTTEGSTAIGQSEGSKVEEETTSGRPRLIIKPRKK